MPVGPARLFISKTNGVHSAHAMPEVLLAAENALLCPLHLGALIGTLHPDKLLQASGLKKMLTDS